MHEAGAAVAAQGDGSGVVDVLKGIADAVSISSALITVAVLALVVFKDLRTGYRLLRLMHQGEAGGTHVATIVRYAGILFQDLALFRENSVEIVNRVRRTVEHGIFRPMQQFSWPLPSDDPAYDEQDYRGTREETAAARAAAKARFRAARKQWAARMRTVHHGAGRRIIVNNPSEINQKQPRIKRYFDALKVLGVRQSPDQFICDMEIETGFIAPIHLLTGLLTHFSQGWPAIIDNFNLEAQGDRGLHFGSASRDIRQIQQFIYTCWLLWGPSIPICAGTCDGWRADYLPMQFGFGDENNSIEIVGRRERMIALVSALAANEKQRVERDHAVRYAQNEPPAISPFSAMAIRARAKGRLRLSGSIKSKASPDVSGLPRAALRSWTGGQDERPLFYIDFKDDDGADVGEGRFEVQQDNRNEAFYYSAYLWVAFVITVPDHRPGQAGAWLPSFWSAGLDALPGRPAAARQGSTKPWRDIIPFFEHCNIADSETCAFLKRQLARKIVSAFAELVKDWQPGQLPHTFRYVCAIDDPGCDEQHFLIPDLQGGKTLRTLIEEEIAQRADEGSAVHRLLRDEVLDFGAYDRTLHPFASCHMPDHITTHYAEMQVS